MYRKSNKLLITFAFIFLLCSCSSTKNSYVNRDYRGQYTYPSDFFISLSDNPYSSVTTVDPSFITENYSLERFHGSPGPDRLFDYTDEYIEKWWQKRQYEKKQAKWRRHKKKFYKNGLKFLNTFYDDLYAANESDFTEKYASHVDSVLMPALGKDNGQLAWDVFGKQPEEASERKRITITPYQEHWFNVQVPGPDTLNIKVRLDDDKNFLINGLQNTAKDISLSPLIRVKSVFLARFYTQLYSETDWDQFTGMYLSHLSDDVRNALHRGSNIYEWSQLKIGRDESLKFKTDDITYDRDNWFVVHPKNSDNLKARIQLKVIDDKLVITGLVVPSN